MIAEFMGALGKMVQGEVILTEFKLDLLARKMMSLQEFAFDTETDTLRVKHKGEMKLVGISICFGEEDAYYIPTGHVFDRKQLSVEKVANRLREPFEREDVRIIGQGMKFDLHVMANIDVNIRTKDLFDTMLARWITDENKEKGLKGMTSQIYGVAQTKFDACLATVTAEEKKMYGLKPANKPPFHLVRIAVGAPYAIGDAYWTWRHYCDWQMDMIEHEEMKHIFYKVQIPFLSTLYNMERRGVKIDVKKLKEMETKANIDLAQLEYDMTEIAGVEFNPGSGQQVGELLFGWRKVNKKGEFVGNVDILEKSFNYPMQGVTPTGAPKTGGKIIKTLLRLTYKRDKRKIEGLKLVRLLIRHKKLSKLKSAFIDGLLTEVYADGKIHCNFNQVGTDSGRLSCSEPNLQQLPRPIDIPTKEEWESYGKTVPYEEAFKEELFWKFYEIRSAFIPDDIETESVLALDFSNLEMRILAHFSQDPNLVETFVHEHDAHGATAVNMFALDCDPDKCKKMYPPLRQIAKTINFLLMYGGGAYTLYTTLTDEDAVDENGDPVTEAKAKEYYDKYFEAYSGVKEFIESQKTFAHKYEQVYSVIGRKRRLPDINSNDYKVKGYNERLSVNSPVQGSAGDLMMLCQPAIENDKRLQELNCRMVLQVHDELVFICPDANLEEATAIIKNYMEHPLPKPLNVPLRADYDNGKCYASAK